MQTGHKLSKSYKKITSWDSYNPMWAVAGESTDTDTSPGPRQQMKAMSSGITGHATQMVHLSMMALQR
jgi:hypothetical protein